MPKMIDPELKARAVRLVSEHRGEYPTLTAASQAVAKQVGVGKESVRRWVIQAEIDAGQREGVTSEESDEIRRLKTENRRLREDVAILKAAATFFASRPPQPLMMGFIDEMRAHGFAVESICRVLREQGCQVAARTYRAWRTGRVAARTVTDAQVVDVVRELVWQTDPRTGRLVMAPEGLYGRRKMTALIRRGRLGDASAGSVDRAMRTLGLSGVRRDKHVRTTVPAKDGIRAGDLLNRDFTAPAPNRVWVTDFTYVHCISRPIRKTVCARSGCRRNAGSTRRSPSGY
jgi:transposase-like protein